MESTKTISGQVRLNEDELSELANAIPVNAIRDNRKLADYVKEHGLSNMQLAGALTYIGLKLPQLRMIDVAKDSEITFGQLYEYFERAETNFIILHRVNFLVHQSMIAVYDLLEKENRLRFAVKKHSKDAERAWKEYEEPRRKKTEQTAWFTMQDHFVIMEDMLSEHVEKVYATIRDHMIQIGWRDIEVKGRIELAFLMVKCARHSFRAFFKEFEDASGADFSKCFKYADMDVMVKSFARMTEALGIKVETDRFGFYDIAGLHADKCHRVAWAWDDFIKALRDEDLMDESAKQAMEYNPKIKEVYQNAVEESERKEFEESVEKMGEKFKVTKSK